MTDYLPVVDLFSGPGGLAEGFASCKDSHGRSRFRIALSVEMDEPAHRTLRLRSFLRKFSTGFPAEYYDFLNGVVSHEPDWANLYPQEWRDACNETQRLTLGTPESSSFIRQRIAEIRAIYDDRTVLIGGPPCQSYSVVGRSRNASNPHYNPANDKRQSLYREYAEALKQLQPVVAIMENVRGMLSARHLGNRIFSEIMDSLANAGGKDQYFLYSLAPSKAGRSWREGLQPEDFLVRAEEHGIPQKRHRVIVLCIRRDIATTLQHDLSPKLAQSNTTTSVSDIIGAMPRLRSRLSRDDSDTSWQQVLQQACRIALRNIPPISLDMEQKFRSTLERVMASTSSPAPPFRGAPGDTHFPATCPSALSEWMFEHSLTRLPNNETRGHISEDLTRYLYATAYAHASGISPKARDFPQALAARHRSWNTGKFDDRFRVQLADHPSTTVTSHLSKDGHYFIHPDPTQCRSLTVREAARLQTFPDNYFFHGTRTQQYIQVGNAVPPYLAWQIARELWKVLELWNHPTKPVTAHESTNTIPGEYIDPMPAPFVSAGSS